MKHIAIIVIATLMLSLAGAMAYATKTPADNSRTPTMLVIDTEESDDEMKTPETVFGSLDAPQGAIKLVSTQVQSIPIFDWQSLRGAM